MGVATAQQFHFGDFTLDQSRYRLQRGAHLLRLEKIPMELLILLIQRRGELVSREEIAQYLWGKDVFLDVDHGINTAIRKIRVVLRDDPEKPRFVETVVGKGYRFAAPTIFNNGDSNPAALAELSVEVQALASPPQVASRPAPLPTEERGISIGPKVLLGGAALLALLTLALLLNRGRAKGTRPPAIRSLAVLPLKNLSGDPTQEYLADGMTEALIGRLSRIQDLRVISRTSVMHFKDTQLSVPEIARTLRVDAIVEGSVMREGSRIRVHAQLIRGSTDDHFWSEAYDREVRDMLALQSDVAQSIAGKVEVTITGKERATLTAVRFVSPEVYESYLKGRFALHNRGNTRAGVDEGIGHFREAIKRDPAFAPAYLGLANGYAELSTVFIGAAPESWCPKAISAARRALELDPDLAEAHVLLAQMQQKQWQWEEAEAEYRRALELNPGDAAAHAGLAQWLLTQGRTGEALVWIQRGRELDPLAVSGANVAWILFHARRYDEAIHELRSVLAVDPDDATALWYLGFVFIADGKPGEAIPVLERAVSISQGSPGIIGVLVSAYGHAGRRLEALRLLDELKRRRQTAYVPATALLNGYLGLGENDQAFAWLEQAYKEQSNILQWLKVHPFFDPLRNDPRFRDMLRRTNLSG